MNKEYKEKIEKIKQELLVMKTLKNLKKANSENRFMNRLNHYAKYKVLIIDEMGLSTNRYKYQW